MSAIADADLSRYDDVLAWFRREADRLPDLRCAWVGGSAATGRYDTWSDLDIDVLSRPGTHSLVFAALLHSFQQEFGSDDGLWEPPPGVWLDGEQFFAALMPRPGDLAAPTRIVDLVVQDATDERRRVDVRRHGSPIVLHDPDGLLDVAHESDAQHAGAAGVTLEQIRQRRPFAEWLVNRALARGELPEAVATYLRLGLTPIAELLRARDCPWRHDYGLRYLRDDLAAADVDRFEALLPGVERLRELSRECFAWQDELLTAAVAAAESVARRPSD